MLTPWRGVGRGVRWLSGTRCRDTYPVRQQGAHGSHARWQRPRHDGRFGRILTERFNSQSGPWRAGLSNRALREHQQCPPQRTYSTGANKGNLRHQQRLTPRVPTRRSAQDAQHPGGHRRPARRNSVEDRGRAGCQPRNRYKLIAGRVDQWTGLHGDASAECGEAARL